VSGGLGPLADEEEEREVGQRGRREGGSIGGATKPPTPLLAAMEAAEQALNLRVWGWGSPAPTLAKKRLPMEDLEG
jgi:hypothetical protein